MTSPDFRARRPAADAMTEPYFDNGIVQLYQADARDLPLEDASVHCAVTSPPYWGLRDYGLESSVWGGDPDHGHEREDASWQRRSNDAKPGPKQSTNQGSVGRDVPVQGAFCECGAWLGTLGLEPTPDLYVQHIVEVFREVRRVLRDDGTLWLNLGDSRVVTPKGNLNGQDKSGLTSTLTQENSPAQGVNKLASGLKPKNLVGIPWRVAFALQADGWYLRCDIIWSKPNPMPESVQDRPTKAHEYVFLLTKKPRYYYDHEAIKEPVTGNSHPRGNGVNPKGGHNKLDGRYRPKQNESWSAATSGLVENRNRRDVWTIPTQPYPEAHFATFPEALTEPCILAGTSERGVCAVCGAPWERVVERKPMRINRSNAHPPELRTRTSGTMTEPPTSKTNGWHPTCDHDAETVPATVLDPFVGSGTTAAVAQRLGRRAIGVDLSAEYLELAQQRVARVTLPMDEALAKQGG